MLLFWKKRNYTPLKIAVRHKTHYPSFKSFIYDATIQKWKLLFKKPFKFTLRTWLIVVSTLFISGIGIIYLIRNSDSASANWADNEFTYRVRIPITYSGSQKLTEYQVLVEGIDTAALITAGKMQSDCDDMRFYAENGTKLDFTRLPATCNTTDTKVWVKTDTINASDTNIYFYYGNASAQGESDIDKTFRYKEEKTVAYILQSSVDSLDVISLTDNNSITHNGTTVNLNLGETAMSPFTESQFSPISAKGLFHADDDSDNTDMIVPISWAGTEFYYFSRGTAITMYTIAPWGNATVTAYSNGSALTGCNGVTVSTSGTTLSCTGVTSSSSIRVTSTVPILIFTELTSTITDAYPVKPVSTHPWIGGGSTTVISNGSSSLDWRWIGNIDSSETNPANLSANTYDNSSVTSDSNYGGGGILIRSANGVYSYGVNQYGDGDGSDGHMFQDITEVGTAFGSAHQADYISISSTVAATCSIYNAGSNTPLGTGTAASSNTSIYGLGFGTGTTNTYTSGAWYMVCDAPVVAHWQDSSDTEENLMHHVQMRQFTYPTPVVGSFGTEEVSSGPIAYWKFDEGGGTWAYDSVGGNTGTLGSGNSAPTWQTEDKCILGTCLYFDGTNDKVTLGTTSFLGPTGDFTVSAWVKTVAGSEEMTRIIYSGGSTGNNYWQFNIQSSGVLAFQEDGVSIITGTKTIPKNTWTHVAVVKSGNIGNNISFYVDGQLDTTGATGTVLASGTKSIGIRMEATGLNVFKGYIDEVKIYPYARTADEIKSDYITGASASGSQAVLGAQDESYLSDGLVGYWKMDEIGVSGSNWTAIDSSGNGNNGTGAGNASVGSTAAGKFANAGFFDGNGDYITIPNSSSLNITGNSVTMAAWIKPTTLSGNDVIISKGVFSGNKSYRLMRVGSVAHLEITTDTGTTTLQSNTALTTGIWQHVVAVYDGSKVSIYINGKLDRSSPFSGNIVSHTENLWLGWRSGALEYFNGSMDEVRIYNRAFTEREVFRLYEWAPGPVAYYKMEKGQAALDSSGNNFSGSYPDTTQGITHGFIDGNLTIIPEQWGGSANAGEFDITCPGGDANCNFTDTNGYHSTPSIVNGVACQDGATGTGYIMYTATSVFTRFSGHDLSNSPHFTCVRYNSGWQYDNNTSWVNFTPVATDTLIAEVDFTSNTVTYLNGIPRQTIGKFGGGLQFDGTSDIVNFTGDTSIINTFSFGGWFKATATHQVDTQSTSGVGGISGQRYAIWPASALDNARAGLSIGTNGISVYEHGNSYMPATAVYNATIGSDWNHVFVVYENKTPSIYLNGVKVHTGSTSPRTNVYAPYTSIGGGAYGYFAGSIDEVKIYNYARTQKQVVQDMNTHSVSSDFPLRKPLGYWKTDEGAGSTAYNSGSAGSVADGTISGATWTSSGKYGSALSYDGINDQTLVNSTLGLAKNTDITVSLWVNLPDTSESGSFIKIGSEVTGDNDGFGVGVGASTFDTEGNDLILLYESVRWIDTNTTIGTGWHHIVATINESGVPSAYIDGVSIGSFAGSNMNAPEVTDTIKIGGYVSTTPTTRAGQYTLDEIKVYDYAFTASDVLQDYNMGVSAVPFAHWKLDEGYGSVIHNSFDASTSTQGYIHGASWANDGKYGKALDFDGVNDYAVISQNTSFDISTFTVSAWFKWESEHPDDLYRAIISKSPNSGNGNLDTFLIYVVDDTRLVGARVGTGSTNYNFATKKKVDDSQWHQVVLVYDSVRGIGQLYLDGRLEDEQSGLSAATTSTDPIYLGVWKTSTVYGEWDGLIDEVKMYNYPLTADEVRTEFNQGKAIVLGSSATTSSGTKSNSASREYCVPGDTATCNVPVAHFSLDENTGVTANNITASNIQGTLTNGAEWSPGVKGSSLQFDGANDYVTLGSPSGLNLSTDVTLSAWIKPTKLSANNYIFASSDNAGGLQFAVEVGRTANKLSTLWGTSGGGFDILYSNQSLNLNEWQHIVVTRSGSGTSWEVQIYINGVLDSTQAGTKAVSSYVNSFLGNFWTTNTTQTFGGTMDEVKVYNYVRTPAQIVWDYSRGAPVAHYKMDECEGTTIYNSAPTFNDEPAGNNGTISLGGSGSQTSAGSCATSGAWANGATGKRGASVKFDGTDDMVTFGDSESWELTAPFTLSAWINANSLSPSLTNTILSKYTTSSNQREWFLGIYLDTPIFNKFPDGTPTVDSLRATQHPLELGRWYHILFTFDENATGTFYIDGKMATSGSLNSTTIFKGNASATMGRLSLGGSNNNPFDGKIDDVRIYNYVLTPHQVKVIHNNGAVSFE